MTSHRTRAIAAAVLLSVVLGLVVLLVLQSEEKSRSSKSAGIGSLTWGRGSTSSPSGSLDDLFAKVAARAPAFGGMFIDESNSLRVYVVDLAEREAVQRAIIEVFGHSYLDHDVRFVLGQYGFARLKSWFDRQKTSTLVLPGVVLTGIDESKNALEIGVSSQSAVSLVKQNLRGAEVPLEAVRIFRTKPLVTLEGKTLRDTQRPLLGGLRIERSASGGGRGCTLGLPAVRGNVPGFITASHCTASPGGVQNTVFHQAKTDGVLNQVGIESVDPPYLSGGNCPSGRVCGLSDSAFIRRDSGPDQATLPDDVAFGYIATPNDSDVVIDRFRIRGISLVALEGEYLSKVGARTGLSTGKVVDTCTDMAISTSPVIQLACQYSVDADHDLGDSGAPVFYWSCATLPPDAFCPATLYGILWGGPLGGPYNFSPIGSIETELGLKDVGLFLKKDPRTRLLR